MEAFGPHIDRSRRRSAAGTFPVHAGRVDTHGFNGLPRDMVVDTFKTALICMIR